MPNCPSIQSLNWNGRDFFAPRGPNQPRLLLGTQRDPHQTCMGKNGFSRRYANSMRCSIQSIVSWDFTCRKRCSSMHWDLYTTMLNSTHIDLCYKTINTVTIQTQLAPLQSQRFRHRVFTGLPKQS